MASLTLLVVVVAAALLAETPPTEAVNCSPIELTPCAPAIMSNKQPSSMCCSKLEEQKPCLCGYYKNPTYRPYVDSPGAKRMAATCKVNVSC